MTAFRDASRAFDQDTIAAYGLVSADPASGIAAIDAVLGRIDGMQTEELAVDELMGAGVRAGDCRALWLSRRTSALDMRFAGAALLGSKAETVRTAAMARAALDRFPDHPYWASILEREAELADNVAARDATLDDAFARRLAAGASLEAARNRFRAATLSGGDGRITRLRQCAAQAIDIADTQGLLRESVWFRMQLYALLLIWDAAGVTRDEVRRANDFIGRLRGTLPDRLERSYGDAIAAGQGDAAGLDAERAELRVELLLLAADLKSRLGDNQTPVFDILPLAERGARKPEQTRKVLAAFSASWQALGNTKKALDYALRALEISKTISAPAQAQAAARLAALQQADAEPDPDWTTCDDPADAVQRGIGRVIAQLQNGAPEPALVGIDALLPHAASAQQRALLTSMRGSAYLSSARPAAAEIDFAAAAEIADAALADDPDAVGDLAMLRESAMLLHAVALTRLERPVDAWNAAERARAPVLRRLAGIVAESWAQTRDHLAERGAAILSISALRWGTLVLSAAPGDAEPQAALLDGLHAADVNRLLDAASDAPLADDSEAWTAKLIGAAPELSALLMPQLGDRLRALAARAELLYLIPDDNLFQAPFAALDVAPGITLAELIPFSIIPFAALLGACPPAPLRPRSALLVASGVDTQGYDFTGHLDTVGPALAGLDVTRLGGPAATADALLESAGARDILHVSSHGEIDPQVADVARASYLLLHDRHLAAAEIAEARVGPGLAAPSLTLLNACQSGRFRRTCRTELGGFPAAMLRGGRRTLIAPLVHVDPHAAGSLAAAFFTALLGGQTAARALQTARRTLIAGGAPPSDWAAHAMFGVDG